MLQKLEFSSAAPTQPSIGSRIFKAVLQTGKDPVWIFLFVSLGLLAFFNLEQFSKSIVFMAKALLSLAPYFALALAFAASAKATGADVLMSRAFSGRPLYAIMGATLAGALSPFCSCGVIPLIAALLGAGVPLAPVMAFWVSSPIMDPEMFILTVASIGLNFSIAKTFAAIGMGLFAGTITHMLSKRAFLQDPMKTTTFQGCGTSSCTPKPKEIIWTFWRHKERLASFWSEIRSIGGFLGKWLTVAFFLETLMLAWVNPVWIKSVAGAESAFAIPIAAIVGMPSYLNGYAALPLASALLDLGMSNGAALAFLTAGSVSSIPAAIAVYSLVKKPVFALYVVLGLTGSLVAGYLYQFSGVSI